MTDLQFLIESELRKCKCIENVDALIAFMRDNNFFKGRCSGHDRWVGGLPQHSWRVYQYALEIKRNLPTRFESKKSTTKGFFTRNELDVVTEEEIALAALLHDIGKVAERSQHERKSYKILRGLGFSKEKHKSVLAAILQHHHEGKHSHFPNMVYAPLSKLIRRADGMASGTAWNWTRYKEGKTQFKVNETKVHDMSDNRKEALARTAQTLVYGMYCDHDFNLCTVEQYRRTNIRYGVDDKIQKAVGFDKCIIPSGVDWAYYTREFVGDSKDNYICIVIPGRKEYLGEGIESARQGMELELMICSNLLVSLFGDNFDHDHRFSPKIVDSVKEKYTQDLKYVYLPGVTMIRDGEKSGYMQVKPWRVNVLVVPGYSRGQQDWAVKVAASLGNKKVIVK